MVIPIVSEIITVIVNIVKKRCHHPNHEDARAGGKTPSKGEQINRCFASANLLVIIYIAGRFEEKFCGRLQSCGCNFSLSCG
jgi:hypothetical protein